MHVAGSGGELGLQLTLQPDVRTVRRLVLQNPWPFGIAQFVGGVGADTSTTCEFTFTSGTGNKFLKYCITKNGNIAQFQSPSGMQYISTAPVGEGYAFCDFDSSTQYYDYAGFGDSGSRLR